MTSNKICYQLKRRQLQSLSVLSSNRIWNALEQTAVANDPTVTSWPLAWLKSIKNEKKKISYSVESKTMTNTSTTPTKIITTHPSITSSIILEQLLYHSPAFVTD